VPAPATNPGRLTLTAEEAAGLLGISRASRVIRSGGAFTHPSDFDSLSALGGIRTPNLLIRSQML
jgi:hypothetical protein